MAKTSHKVAREVDALLAAGSSKSMPAQLQHKIDEMLASPGSFSYEEAMGALEKKHAGVPRGGSLRAGTRPRCS